MTMIVEVWLYGKLLGTAEWNTDRGSTVFQYSSEMTGAIEPSPVLMPTEQKYYETNRDHLNFHSLPYLLSDSMPDDFGHIMMKAWLKQRDLAFDGINPVDRLTYIGKRGMGALEYIPANHRENDDNPLAISEIYDVARKVLESKKEAVYPDLGKESLTEILRIGSSVGGARAKALIAVKLDESHNIQEIRPGDILQPEGFSYWLLKIDGANEQRLGEGEGMGRLEYAYYQLAKLAGLNMSESFLQEENGRYHFMTRRFDRTDTGEKIHMQTFAALAGIDYKIQKAASYETLFRAMRRLRLPYDQLEQQYRRMLFNVVARNHDDHVKNFSFLMDKNGSWQIAPAYDICFSYSPGGTWTNVHQSSINGKYDNFTKEDLFEFARFFGIKKTAPILEEVVTAVNQWPVIAKALEIPADKINSIYKNLRINDF
jgi:serine/threonine-protein kinase HipA